MDKTFCIGEFVFRLRCPDEIQPPANFLQFAADDGRPVQFTYDIEVADELPRPETILVRHPDLAVFSTPGGEGRLLNVRGETEFYACYRETDAAHARISVTPEKLDSLRIDTMFVSLLALERRMIERGGMVLHCAYVHYNGKAILFSAPSGTGKSTQAGLWEQYRGADTVNGDRALLACPGGVWTAQGWPVCGSSKICHLRALPIHAIVMLRQAPENTVQRLHPAQAFAQLYTQITANRWNQAAHLHTIGLIEQLVGQVPVFELGCTISEQAVECLEQALYPAE